MVPPEGHLSEAETREQIDRALISAGWVIQDKKRLNLYSPLDRVVRQQHSGGCTQLAECAGCAPMWPAAMSAG